MRGAMPLPAQALEQEGFTLLCVPGGFAQHYRNALGEEGRARIEARRAQAFSLSLSHNGTSRHALTKSGFGFIPKAPRMHGTIVELMGPWIKNPWDTVQEPWNIGRSQASWRLEKVTCTLNSSTKSGIF